MTYYETQLLNLVHRLRECKVSAPPEHPVHPKICSEAADFLERTLASLKEYDEKIASFNERLPDGLTQAGNRT